MNRRRGMKQGKRALLGAVLILISFFVIWGEPAYLSREISHESH